MDIFSQKCYLYRFFCTNGYTVLSFEETLTYCCLLSIRDENPFGLGIANYLKALKKEANSIHFKDTSWNRWKLESSFLFMFFILSVHSVSASFLSVPDSSSRISQIVKRRNQYFRNNKLLNIQTKLVPWLFISFHSGILIVTAKMWFFGPFSLPLWYLIPMLFPNLPWSKFGFYLISFLQGYMWYF